MRKLILILCIATTMLTYTIAGGDGTIGSLPGPGASSGMSGDPKGVQDDSCWETPPPDPKRVKYDQRGTLHGDLKCKVSIGDKTSTEVSGDPAADGGCSNSEPMLVDGETFKCDGDKLKVEGDDGKYKTCTKKDDEDCAKGDEIEFF